MRLDKFLSVTGCCSRADAKRAVRGGNVWVNGQAAHAADMKIDENKDQILYFGKEILYQKYLYIMMNKPAGVVSATEDERELTVLNLLPDEIRREGLFPCGRLDKNTVGLLLVTDDGELAHRLLSPKNHVAKDYYFCSKFPISDEDCEKMEQGLVLDDGYVTLPARITLDEGRKSGKITLTEGKYHQIKRMLEAVHNQITFLERIRFGCLTLDSNLNRGEWRFLTSQEIAGLEAHAFGGSKRNL